MNLFLKLLSKEQRNVMEIGQSIFAQLDTPQQRKEAFDYALEVLADGTVTLPEWGKLGGKLGIIKGNGKRKKKTGRHKHQR
tara:strand:- start:177 stop:419 length:243 start_codon:yes stop_codon:yes gene_type:complete